MSAPEAHTLSKEERISSKLLIDKLFNGGGSHAMAAFPLRLVYMQTETATGAADEPPVRILVSVPKRCFKRAVKRNRVKRQIREAYRKNKQLLTSRLAEGGNKGFLLAFIWLDTELHTSEKVERRVKQLLQRLSERL